MRTVWKREFEEAEAYRNSLDSVNQNFDFDFAARGTGYACGQLVPCVSGARCLG
jgi:hypothetical protein